MSRDKACVLVNGLGCCVVNQKHCKPDLSSCTDILSAYYYGMKTGLVEKHHAEMEAINKDCGYAVKMLKELATHDEQKEG